MKWVLVLYSSFFLVLHSIISCDDILGSCPRTIYIEIGLSINSIPSNLDYALFQLRINKRNGNLRVYSVEKNRLIAVSAEEYVKVYYISSCEKDIEKIKALRGNKESQPIIDLGLSVHYYLKDIYKNDYMRIAKMIDEDVSDDEIDFAINQLEEEKGTQLNEMRIKTLNLLLPYADKYGIEYKPITY